MIKKFFMLVLLIFNFNACFAASLPNPISGQSATAIDDAFDAALSGSDVMFTYGDNKVYQIYCQPGFVTDIRLAQGDVVNYIGAGDTVRWIIDQGKVGSGNDVVNHIYVKPIQQGIATNLVINTNERNYQINMIAGNYYNPGVLWQYPINKKKEFEEKIVKDYLTFDSEKLNFDYIVSETKFAWSPQSVFDDGKKTYLKMKPSVFNVDMPAFFVLDKKNKIVLVNYRVVKGIYVVDRLFERGQLVVGTEKVIVKRK